jgi:hypothetical protein
MWLKVTDWSKDLRLFTLKDEHDRVVIDVSLSSNQLTIDMSTANAIMRFSTISIEEDFVDNDFYGIFINYMSRDTKFTTVSVINKFGTIIKEIVMTNEQLLSTPNRLLVRGETAVAQLRIGKTVTLRSKQFAELSTEIVDMSKYWFVDNATPSFTEPAQEQCN